MLIVCGLVWTVILSVSAGAVKIEDEEGEAQISVDDKAMKSTILVKEYESERAIR